MGIPLWGKFMTLIAYYVAGVSWLFHNNLQGICPLNSKEVGNVMPQVTLSAAEAPDSCSRPYVQSGNTASPNPHPVDHPLGSLTFSWVVRGLARKLPSKLKESITWGPSD